MTRYPSEDSLALRYSSCSKNGQAEFGTVPVNEHASDTEIASAFVEHADVTVALATEGATSDCSFSAARRLLFSNSIQRFYCSNVEERANLERRRHAIVGSVDANKEVSPREQRHLRVTDLVRLATRHHQPEWLKRLLVQEFLKGLECHNINPTAPS